MRYIVVITLFLFSKTLLSQNTAPTDYTVKSISTVQSKENFFQFSSGNNAEIDQSNWDIAIYNEVHEIGGKVNEAMGVKVWRVYRDTSNFSSLTMSDTLTPMYNSNHFMYLGALDTIYTGAFSTYFRIGLGRFFENSSGYVADGYQRMYIIRKSNGSYAKFYLKSYGSRKFDFLVANMDNSDMKTISVNKIVPMASHYQYLNLTTNAVSSSYEPTNFKEWDVVAKPYFETQSNVRTSYPVGFFLNNPYNLIRYSQSLGSFADTLPSNYLNYAVGGVATEAYEAAGDPMTAVYNQSLNASYDNAAGSFAPISRLCNQIGVKWYEPTTNQVKSGVSYFLRDRVGKVWHIIFTNYNASSQTLTFAYKQVGSHSSVASSHANSEFELSQINGKWQVTGLGLQKNEIELYDLSGKLLSKSNFSTRFVVDNIRTQGVYLLRVYNAQHQVVYRLIE